MDVTSETRPYFRSALGGIQASSERQRAAQAIQELADKARQPFGALKIIEASEDPVIYEHMQKLAPESLEIAQDTLLGKASCNVTGATVLMDLTHYGDAWTLFSFRYPEHLAKLIRTLAEAGLEQMAQKN